MRLPVQVTFRNTRHSRSVEQKIHRYAQQLESFYDRIISCRVVVECTHRTNNLYQITINLLVPGRELVVGRDTTPRPEHEDIYIAIHEAFDATRRQLQDYAERERGNVKAHGTKAPVLHGHISKLFLSGCYGFIEADDGRELYFHGHSVEGAGFTELIVGYPVTFTEAEAEKGPRAKNVRIAGAKPLKRMAARA